MAIKNEYHFHKIRVNGPLEIGEKADLTLIQRDGSWKQVQTSSIENFFISGDSVHVSTKNSIYYGELENPKDLNHMMDGTRDFARALDQLSQEAAQDTKFSKALEGVQQRSALTAKLFAKSVEDLQQEVDSMQM